MNFYPWRFVGLLAAAYLLTKALLPILPGWLVLWCGLIVVHYWPKIIELKDDHE